MTNKTPIRSVEPNIADLANSWMKSYKLDYKLEQEELNMDNKFDIEFMKTFISAIQKLVIKDVVLYSDRKIEETRKLVLNN